MVNAVQRGVRPACVRVGVDVMRRAIHNHLRYTGTGRKEGRKKERASPVGFCVLRSACYISYQVGVKSPLPDSAHVVGREAVLLPVCR